MTILMTAGDILGTSLGSFVYHLLMLLAVEAALAMAWGEWRRARDEQARRLLLAMAGLAGARVLYIAAALLALAGQVPATRLLPLERMVDTASICLLGWGVAQAGKTVSRGQTGARIWGWLLGANLTAAIAVGVTFMFLWSKALIDSPGLVYAQSWQSTVWCVWQMALAALVGLASLRNPQGTAVRSVRSAYQAPALGAMLFLFLGGLLQMLTPEPVPGIPVWARLSNLVAYPLIVAAVYQSIVASLRLEAEQSQEISQASLDQIKSLLLLFEGARQVSGSLSLPAVLENAVRAVARALDADQCAIALPEETDPGYMRLAAVYNAQAGKPVPLRGEAATFPLEYQLTIQQAMRRKKYIVVDDPDNVQLRVLFNLLGSSDAGPLLVQPLLLDGEAIGAILVGNSRSRRSFTPNEAKLCQSMAEHVLVAIRNARRYQAAQDRIRELHRALGDQHRGSVGDPFGLDPQGARLGDSPRQRMRAWELADPILGTPPEVEEAGPAGSTRSLGPGQVFTGS